MVQTKQLVECSPSGLSTQANTPTKRLKEILYSHGLQTSVDKEQLAWQAIEKFIQQFAGTKISER